MGFSGLAISKRRTCSFFENGPGRRVYSYL